MRSVARAATLAMAAALLLGACGGGATPPPAGACFGPCGRTLPPMSADAHGWHAVVTIAGGTLTETLTVPGPLRVIAGCVPPLSIWIVDRTGNPQPSPTPQGVHCLAITIRTIPAGTTATLTASIPAPSSLPPGYTVHGQVAVAGDGATPGAAPGGNAPVVRVLGNGL